MSTQDLVTIRKYGTPQEAHLARSVLDAAGIEACVTDESAATWMWYIGTALGGARVQVAERDAARARQVLEETAAQTAANDSGDWRCPHCGAEVEAGFDVCWSCETPRGESATPAAGEASLPHDAVRVPSHLDDEVADASVELPGDADAARAWRAALFGIFFPPLFLYALYLVLKTMNQELSSRGTRHFCGALGVSLLATTLFASLLANWR